MVREHPYGKRRTALYSSPKTLMHREIGDGVCKNRIGFLVLMRSVGQRDSNPLNGGYGRRSRQASFHRYAHPVFKPVEVVVLSTSFYIGSLYPDREKKHLGREEKEIATAGYACLA